MSEKATEFAQGATVNAVLPPIVERAVAPITQLAAGALRGAAVPLIGRGGRGVLQTVEELNAGAPANAQITGLTAADVTGSPGVRALQSGVTQSPFGAGLRDAALAAGDQVEARSAWAAEQAGGAAYPSGPLVGQRVAEGSRRGIERWETSREGLDAMTTRLMGADRPVPPWQLVALRRQFTDDIATGDAALRPRYERALEIIDGVLEASRTSTPAAGPTGTVRWDLLRKVRTDLGKELEWPTIGQQYQPGEAAMGELYGTLTGMLRREAAAAGPAAQAAMGAHDAHVIGFRAPGGAGDMLRRFGKEGANTNDIAAQVRADAMRGGNGLAALREYMDPADFRQAVAGMVHDFGAAAPSKTRPAGDWDPAAFAANFNKMLNQPGTRAVLARDPALAGPMADWARIAHIGESMAGTRALANSSNTAGASIVLAALGGLGAYAVTGDPGTAGKVGLATLAPAAIGARLFQNPSFVRWLATTTTDAAARGMPAVNQSLGALSAVARHEADPDARRAMLEVQRRILESLKAERGPASPRSGTVRVPAEAQAVFAP